MLRRITPAIVLFFAAPLIAEYLLGSLSLIQIGALPVMCLMYGGGAVLIRELARATKRGWPMIVTLGLAYGLVEEAFATQSLFNPHYLGLRLLDYGFIPALGISGQWTAFVLSLHVIWSICVPIGLVEALFPEAGESPWLRIPGRIVVAVLYALGIAAVASYTKKTEHFVATPAQFAVAAGALAAVVGGAFCRISRPRTEGRGPNFWFVAILMFVLGSAFELTPGFKDWGLPGWSAAATVLLIDGVGFGLIAWLSMRSGWSALHRYAAVAGALVVYCWCGFRVEVSLHGSAGLVPHAMLVVVAVIVMLVAGRRVGRAAGR